MADSEPDDPLAALTVALQRLGSDGEGVSNELAGALARELRAIARAYLGPEAQRHTLQPTALVNEAFLKLFGHGPLQAVRDRGHFFALAARVMRQVLVDHARQRNAAKRDGGGARVTLGEVSGLAPTGDDELLDVDLALTELAELDPRQARVVELRFFVGLEVTEVAEAMGLSVSTVEREWRAARAWLGRRMAERRSP